MGCIACLPTKGCLPALCALPDGRTAAQVRGAVCQRPRSLVYVAGAPTHEQHEREDHPWARMDARFSVRHLVAPMLSLAQQCAVPAANLVRFSKTPTLFWC